MGDKVYLKFIKVGDGKYIITNFFENLSLKDNKVESLSVENSSITE